MTNRRFGALADPTDGQKFANNAIRTSKYTVITFVFLNLWEQFQKYANIYFLFVAILQAIPIFSSMTPTSWLPLVVVLAGNMLREGIEDKRRHKMDNQINHRNVKAVLTGQTRLDETYWTNVTVGTVVMLAEDEQLPADIIVLATSDSQGGLCYIETANLDGETNLKNKQSVEDTHREMDKPGTIGAGNLNDQCVKLLTTLSVECEHPNANLHAFVGSLTSRMLRDGQATALTNKNVILRGCTLRNTKWVIGLVIFTGMETKLMMNATDKRFKRTTLERLTNKYLLGIFVLLGILCLVGGLISGLWQYGDDSWYLKGQHMSAGDAFLNIITFLILLNALIPISLTITMETVKVGHAWYMNQDLHMCYTDPDTGVVTPARARTSNLGEDLGRIEYIFSDKTGTLTQNVMEFMKFSCGGIAYGTGTTEIGMAAALREGRTVEKDRPDGLVFEKGNNFWDPRVNNGKWREESCSKQIRDMFLNLAVCHTVMAKPKSGDADKEENWQPDNIAYQAASPDEEALVIGAKCSGFWYKKRNFKTVEVIVEGEGQLDYEVLNINEFNSTRKRMSAMVKTPDGKRTLLVKGADTVIFERLAHGHSNLRADTTEHLRNFANEGLRTLVIAQREVSDTEYEEWNKKYMDAFLSTTNREEKLEACAEEIEVGLELVGATAIEDKLQVGVPACVKTLAEANIQIWILTGDKVETAINIAMACNLIDLSMNIERITLPDPPQFKADEDGKKKKNRQKRYNEVMEKLGAAAKHVTRRQSSCTEARQTACVIDGYSLEYALEHEKELKEPGKLLDFTQSCRAVVCCRVSPKQKAEVVSLVRDKYKVITLAIGDGANDVGMIMQAHIGVGISGKEGVQAVMASDYAVAQFQYLQQLVLVHGRWDFQKISVLILYFFYKNVAFALTQFWFGIYTGFSGEPFWDDIFQSFWNVSFTSLPIFAVAVFDKDMLFQSTLRHFPQLYGDVQSGRDFTAQTFFWWTLDGIYVSIVTFFIPVYLLSDVTRDNAQVEGKWVLSWTCFAACHLAVNIRLAMVTKTWNYFTVVLYTLSFLSNIVIALFWTELFPQGWNGDYYRITTRSLGNSVVWLTLLLTQVLALLPAFIQMAVQKVMFPTKSEKVQRLEKEITKKYHEALYAPVDGKKPSPMTLERRMGRLLNDILPDGLPKIVMSSKPPRRLSAHRVSPTPLDKHVEVQARNQAANALHATSRPLSGNSASMVVEDSEGLTEFLGYAFSNEAGNDPEVQLCAYAPNPDRREIHAAVVPLATGELNVHEQVRSPSQIMHPTSIGSVELNSPKNDKT